MDTIPKGCWIDGHWGQYGTARMIEIAEENGWVDTAAEPPFATLDGIKLAHRHLASMGPSTSEPLTDEEFDQMFWSADDAEAWLNDHIAPDGYRFLWNDGEFFLWPETLIAEEY
jgi:hypothetical protein